MKHYRTALNQRESWSNGCNPIVVWFWKRSWQKGGLSHQLLQGKSSQELLQQIWHSLLKCSVGGHHDHLSNKHYPFTE